MPRRPPPGRGWLDPAAYSQRVNLLSLLLFFFSVPQVKVVLGCTKPRNRKENTIDRLRLVTHHIYYLFMIQLILGGRIKKHSVVNFFVFF